MGWEIVLFILAVVFAFKLGAIALWQAFGNRRRAKAERKAHKSQLVTEAIEKGVAPKQAKAAADAAARLAVTVSSWAAIWIATQNGWKDGWKKGHQRGIELRDGTEPHESADEPAAHQEPTEEPRRKDHEKWGECTAIVGEARHGDHLELRLCGAPAENNRCPEHQPHMTKPIEPPKPSNDKTQQAKPAKENKTMPIETSTGGEVLTKEQLVAEFKAIIAEENGELEDSQAAVKRVEEHNRRLELVAASLASAEIDRATVDAVRTYIDANTSRRPQAMQRVQSTEVCKAGAEKVINTLNGSQQNQFYNA